MKILVVTLNPSVDRMYHVDALMQGGESRVLAVKDCAGGKGVNVARFLRSWRMPVQTLCLQDMLDVPRRVNITILDQAGRSTRFLEKGPHITLAQWHKIEKAIQKLLLGFDILVLSGSLPPGVPCDAYEGLIYFAQNKGVRCVLDTSGPALAHGVAAAPWCVKPNRLEAEALLGQKLRSQRDIASALRTFLEYGIKRVLLSLDVEGLAGADGQRMFWVHTPRQKGLTVGCGDVLLAGFLSQDAHASFEDCLIFAAACGSANVGAKVPGKISLSAIRSIKELVKANEIKGTL